MVEKHTILRFNIFHLKKFDFLPFIFQLIYPCNRLCNRMLQGICFITYKYY